MPSVKFDGEFNFVFSIKYTVCNNISGEQNPSLLFGLSFAPMSIFNLCLLLRFLILLSTVSSEFTRFYGFCGILFQASSYIMQFIDGNFFTIQYTKYVLLVRSSPRGTKNFQKGTIGLSVICFFSPICRRFQYIFYVWRLKYMCNFASL